MTDQGNDSSLLSVLAIDDEPGLRDMLAMGLSRHGYKVSTAANGKEGLALARAAPFDLVICDVMMAGMSGIEVLSDLKKSCPQTEVIIATGHATLETAIEAMKLGAYDYITKPFGVRQLCSIFDRALEHRKLKKRIVDLEELDRLKTHFLSNTSHELRTPLCSILGFHSLLLNGAYGPLTDTQKENLVRANINANNLLRFVTNLLDMSKLAAHKMQIFPKPYDVSQLVREVAKELEPVALEKKLTLQFIVPETCLWVTDKERLKQIFANLTINALKFTSEGSVIVRLQKTEEPMLHFSVEDTGIGIEAKDLPALFQEFHQLDGGTTRPYGGTGLGLSICKEMTDLLGGRIDVQSQPGAGSTFTVVLPMLTDPVPEKAA